MFHCIAPDSDPRLFADPPVVEDSGNLSPSRERLRHLIIGSPEGVRSAIARLHTLQYVGQLAWSQLFRIPPQGITLTPAQGEVFSYLLRYRQLE